MGFTAAGVEYGRAAVARSVCGALWGDLTETLPVADNFSDLTHCVGVLSQIPESLVPHAIGELARVSRSLLFTNILTRRNPRQVHHKTFRPLEWWSEKMEEVGWLRRADMDSLLAQHGHNALQDIWASVWQKSQ